MKHQSKKQPSKPQQLQPQQLRIFRIFPAAKKGHCPLCTIGAAVAVGGATWLGVNHVVIGLFLGAFAASIGFWIDKIIKQRYHKSFLGQTTLLVVSSYLLTVLPLLPLLKGMSMMPWYISWFGSYGSLFNRTYLLNLPLLGSIFGALLVAVAPLLSKGVTKMHGGKQLPFQGIVLTLSLLIITGVIFQLVQ
ncbi:TPA: hypothetical protein HA297_04780 [Candidatus Woesearchaeota archaeon]|nr:hypothetical protein [Candidatus Woesearchaeota archaeon]